MPADDINDSRIVPSGHGDVSRTSAEGTLVLKMVMAYVDGKVQSLESQSLRADTEHSRRLTVLENKIARVEVTVDHLGEDMEEVKGSLKIAVEGITQIKDIAGENQRRVRANGKWAPLILTSIGVVATAFVGAFFAWAFGLLNIPPPPAQRINHEQNIEPAPQNQSQAPASSSS